MGNTVGITIKPSKYGHHAIAINQKHKNRFLLLQGCSTQMAYKCPELQIKYVWTNNKDEHNKENWITPDCLPADNYLQQ